MAASQKATTTEGKKGIGGEGGWAILAAMLTGMHFRLNRQCATQYGCKFNQLLPIICHLKAALLMSDIQTVTNLPAA